MHRDTQRKIVVYLCVFSVCLCGLTLKAQDFEATMAKQGLVDVQKVDPTILVELKYSTTDNFVGKDVYGDLTRAYMQPMAAKNSPKPATTYRPITPISGCWYTMRPAPARRNGNYGMPSPTYPKTNVRNT